MREHLVALIVTAALTGSVLADYVADFDSSGSASDFTTIRNQNGTNQTVTVVSSGDNQLNITTQRGATSTAQLQYAIAPTAVEGAEVALPIGNQADSNRVEARLKFTLATNTLGNITPFTAFGFAGFDSATNTPHFEDKVIIQLNDAQTQFVIRAAADVAGVPGNTMPNTALAATVTLPSTIEVQLTADKIRLLLNDTALTSADTDSNGWFVHGLTLTPNSNVTGFTGDSLIPYFGMVKAGSNTTWTNPATDMAGIGVDDVSATSQTVPEPAFLSMLGLLSIGLLKRPSSSD